MLNAVVAKAASQELQGEEFPGFPGFILRRAVDPDSGGSNAFRMSLVTLESSTGTPRHVHHHSDEGWYIVSGRGVFHANGCTQAIGPGDFLYAARDVVHQLISVGSERLTYVAITAPPCDFVRDNHITEAFDPASHTKVDEDRR